MVSDRIVEGEAQDVLGSTLLAQGEVGAAIRAFEEAVQIGREIHESLVVSDGLAGLARATAVDTPAEAINLFDEAVAYARRHGLGDREASALLAQAGAHRRVGETVEADRAETQAATLLDERGLWSA